MPGLVTVRMSRPELANVGGIVALSALGFLEWPIGLVIAAGHVLAGDRSRTVLTRSERSPMVRRRSRLSTSPTEIGMRRSVLLPGALA